MKLLITNFWTQRNNGDAAILSSTLNFLLELWQTADIRFVSMHADKFTTPELATNPTPTLYFLKSPSKGDVILKYIEFLYSAFFSLVWVFFYRMFGYHANYILSKNMQKVVLAYSESDIILPIGGGYLTVTKGIRPTIFYLTSLFPIFLGIMLRKRVVMLWQSVGPFATWFQKKVTSFVLKRVELIFAREHYTIAMLKSIGIPTEKIIDSGDIAFYFKPQMKQQMLNELRELGADGSRPVVGITARHWFTQGSKEESNYVSSLTESINYLITKGYQIILLPQVTSEYDHLSDRHFFIKIKHHFGDNKDVILPQKDYSHFEYKGIYENLHFLIGTRMHSNIFALTGLTPVLAIAYEYKTRGIMDDLGLSDYVVDINDINLEWIKKGVEKLENNRDEYLDILKNNLNSYIRKLDQSKQIMKDLF